MVAYGTLLRTSIARASHRRTWPAARSKSCFGYVYAALAWESFEKERKKERKKEKKNSGNNEEKRRKKEKRKRKTKMKGKLLHPAENGNQGSKKIAIFQQEIRARAQSNKNEKERNPTTHNSS